LYVLTPCLADWKLNGGSITVDIFLNSSSINEMNLVIDRFITTLKLFTIYLNLVYKSLTSSCGYVQASEPVNITSISISTSHLLESSRNKCHFPSSLQVSSTSYISATNLLTMWKTHENIPCLSFKHIKCYTITDMIAFIILLPEANLQPCEIL
jgi:hypothetical protein